MLVRVALCLLLAIGGVVANDKVVAPTRLFFGTGATNMYRPPTWAFAFGPTDALTPLPRRPDRFPCFRVGLCVCQRPAVPVLWVHL